MKSKILFISLALVLAASLGVAAIGCGDVEPIPPEPTILTIGTARDTDEGLSIFNEVGAGLVMREFVYQVNNVSGGVYLSEYDAYKDLEIDKREISVATWDVGDVTIDICDDIATGDVHFLFGGPGTDCIYTQAPIANAENVVLLTFEGGATGIANDPTKLAVWPYVFITLSYSDWYQMPVLAELMEEGLTKAPGTVKAYVVHIFGEHGDEYLSVCGDYFDVVGSAQVPFDVGDLDADAVILAADAALNATPYDIFCGFVYPDHVFGITGAAMGYGFDPPAMIFGPGANFGFYAYLYPSPGAPNPCLVDGIMSFTVGAYDARPSLTTVYDALAARMDDDAGDPESGGAAPGILSLDYWGIPCYWAALEMWLEAVEDVGYVHQDLLKDALAALNTTTVMADNTWFRMYGGGFGGGNLDYLTHLGEIGQWQNCGYFGTVGYTGINATLPNYTVTGNFTANMQGAWAW